MNVHVYYDDTFNSRFGSQATTKVNALFAMVKTIYAHSSLTTVVEPNVIEITYRAGASWQADSSTLEYVVNLFYIQFKIEKIFNNISNSFNLYVNNYHLRSVSASISANNPSNANAYVYLCSQNDQGGVIGIAWVGSTCYWSSQYRSSVNEYLGNDATSASVCNF